jgi:four helix bundle protein
MRNFREYDIWQDGMALVKEVYILLKDFPKIEQFVLVQQIMRCSVSIPSNIAEGSAKESQKDFARFLEIALGSSFELETQILLSENMGYIENSEVIIKDLNSLQRRISGLIKVLRG